MRWDYTGPSPSERREMVPALLRQHGPMRVSALAELMGVGTCVLTSTAGTLDTLEAEGLIRRDPPRGRNATWHAI